ncbi:MAG: hypothetical protein AAGF31_12425 [Planctomycetota bacterium]
MAWFGFGVSTLASLGFGIWFAVTEIESPGLSIALALLTAATVVTGLGFAVLSSADATGDVFALAWVALAIAIAGDWYLNRYFEEWAPLTFYWVAVHGIAAVGVVLSWLGNLAIAEGPDARDPNEIEPDERKFANVGD